MKRILIIILLIPFLSFSQECIYKINKVDEFTGDKILETKEVAIHSLKGKKINNNQTLEFTITSSNVFSMDENDYLMLKFKSGEVIKMNFYKNTTANYVFLEMLNTTIWTSSNSISINQETADKIKDNEIVKIRWSTSKGYSEKDCKKKHSRNFTKTLSCIGY